MSGLFLLGADEPTAAQRYQTALDTVNSTVSKAAPAYDPVAGGRVQPIKDARDKIAEGWRLAMAQKNVDLGVAAVKAMESLAEFCRNTLLDANGEVKKGALEDAGLIADEAVKRAGQFAGSVEAGISFLEKLAIALGVVIGVVGGLVLYSYRKR